MTPVLDPSEALGQAFKTGEPVSDIQRRYRMEHLPDAEKVPSLIDAEMKAREAMDQMRLAEQEVELARAEQEVLDAKRNAVEALRRTIHVIEANLAESKRQQAIKVQHLDDSIMSESQEAQLGIIVSQTAISSSDAAQKRMAELLKTKRSELVALEKALQ